MTMEHNMNAAMSYFDALDFGSIDANALRRVIDPAACDRASLAPARESIQEAGSARDDGGRGGARGQLQSGIAWGKLAAA